MSTTTIISIIVILLIVIFIFTILKKLIKLALYVAIAVVVILFISNYSINQDLNDITSNYDSSKKTILLVDNKNLIAGFDLNNGVTYFDQEKIVALQEHVTSENYDSILEDSYKLMVFDIKSIESLNDEKLTIVDEEIEKEQVINALQNSDPLSVLEITEQELGVQNADSSEIKARIFAHVMSNHLLSTKSPINFFSQYRKGTIQVHPESPFFSAIKIIPVQKFKQAGSYIVDKTKEKISEAI